MKQNQTTKKKEEEEIDLTSIEKKAVDTVDGDTLDYEDAFAADHHSTPADHTLVRRSSRHPLHPLRRHRLLL